MNHCCSVSERVRRKRCAFWRTRIIADYDSIVYNRKSSTDAKSLKFTRF